jgi:hypothetical protein
VPPRPRLALRLSKALGTTGRILAQSLADLPCGGLPGTQPLGQFRPTTPARDVAHRDGNGLFLQGIQNVNDPTGLAFETELDAFRAGQRLAAELSSTRPNLRGSTCVVVTRRDVGDAYYVSV